MTDDTEIKKRLDRLESLVEEQRATIEDQRERIAQLEGDKRADGTTDEESTVLNRRSALKAGGLLALVFGGVGTASADPQGRVGTAADPLTALHTRAVTSDGSLDVEIDGDGAGGQSLTVGEGADDADLLTIDQGGAVEIPGGPLDLNGNALEHVATIEGASPMEPR